MSASAHSNHTMSEYTPGQVSKMLAIPSSTVRRYVTMFGPFLSAGAQRQRGRVFTENDIAVISKIRDLAAAGIPLAQIDEQLREVIDQQPAEPGELPPQTALAIVTRIGEQVTGIAQRQDQQAQELDELRRRLDEMSQALEDERKTPWYKRLFKRKE